MTTTEILKPMQNVGVDELERLHTVLEASAQARGLLGIAYRTLDSPFGKILIATTERGIVRVAFEREGHDAVLEALANRLSPRILHSPKRLDALASELDEYFRSSRRDFDLPLDLSLTSGYRKTVLEHLPKIGYGATDSYSGVALATGRPRAVRAVGSACSTNPLPLVIPCHRVLRSDGSFGGYLGGIEAKRALLAMESGA